MATYYKLHTIKMLLELDIILTCSWYDWIWFFINSTIEIGYYQTIA